MHVSELYLYPVKSLRGIPLDEATLDERGFHLDRRWMLVDADGVFISQREAPRMALIDVVLTFDGLRVSAPGMEPLDIPAAAHASAAVQARVFDDEVSALPVGRAADEWFSTFLDMHCQLVHMPDESRRVVDRSYVPDERIVGFADAFPLLIIGQGSLDLLNEKLLAKEERPVPMRRFRPNIVVAGTRPHEEDEWRQIRIAAVPVDVVKPCARCVITTVDIDSGVAGHEPLRTLSAYRKHGSKVLFGQNAVHRALGTVRRGDEVTIVNGQG